ncbi:MAG: SpoIIE family protein phosphatase [Candidatus Kapaibacterium sp.]
MFKFTELTTTPVTGIYPRPVPSPFYIIEEIPGRRLTDENNLRADTIEVGSFLIAVEDSAFSDSKGLSERIAEYPDSAHIRLLLFNPYVVEKQEFLVKKEDIPAEFFRPIYNAMLILEIEPGRTAHRAGIQRGDLLNKIGPHDFSPRDNSALRYLRTRESGDIVTYEIIRKDKHIKYELQLAAFGVSFFSLLAFVTSLIFFAIGFFFALKRPRIFAARMIGLLFIMIAGIRAAGIMLNPIDFDTLTTLSYVVYQTGLFMLFPVFIHTTLVFPKEIIPQSKRRRVVLAAYIMGGLIILMSFSPLVFSFRNLELLNTVVNISISALIIYHFGIFIFYRRQISREYWRMAKWIIIAFYISPLVLMFQNLMPWLMGMTITSFSEYALVIANLLIPIAFIYTAWRYRLLDLDMRLRRNIQYVIISSVWVAANIAAFGFIVWQLVTAQFGIPNIYIVGSTIEVAPATMRVAPDDPVRSLILIISSFALAYIFWRIGKSGLRFLDRKFYRIKFDYGKAAAKITEMMEKNISAQDLARGLVEKLGELIRLKRVGVIIFKDEKIVWAQDYYGFKSHSLKEFCQLAGTRIIEAIKIFKGSFRIDYLPSDLKNIFLECKFRYIIPIRSKGQLTGAIFAGEKLSEISFRNEDLEFLSTIARHASVAIENAFLYEDLAQQERIRHELDIARRIQLASLPQKVPYVSGLDISGVSIPALEVGGDFYDFLNGSASELTVVVGDVSGKGTSAALYMSKVQGIMRTLQEFDLPPVDLLIRSNKLLYYSLEKSSFITAIAARIDTMNRRIRFARAGHLPMYHYSAAQGAIRRHVPRGLVLGLSKGKIFSGNIEEMTFDYAPGDVFLFITDGVTEARNNRGEDFDESRLMDCLMRNALKESHAIRDEILHDLAEFTDHSEQYDDITVVVVKATENRS